MRKLLILLLMTAMAMPMPAQTKGKQQKPAQKTQTQKPVKKPSQKEQLQKQKKQVTEQRKANQQRQRELELQVKKRMQDVEALTSSIDDNRITLDSLHQQVDSLNAHIALVDSQLTTLKTELEERRQHYIKSLRYMYRNRNAQNQLMFVLSSQNFNQMFRRTRFMKEYTTYQRAQGEAVKQKSEQVSAKLDELNQTRTHLSTALAHSEKQQQQMEARQAEQKRMVAELQKQQQTVKRLITEQQQEEAKLNAQIDRIIAEELERARKAEEERQRKLAEQRRREEERRQQAANQRTTPKKGKKSTATSSSPTEKKTSSTANKTAAFSAADPDRQLTGSFSNNKGRLPVPITGSYRVVRNFGPYSIAGVTLQSSGIHLQGQAGAQARCIFDGVVSSVFNPGNGIVVMVRHGRYISVYSNLSSASVNMGQKVKINQSLGTIGANNTLVFRLQNWDKVLNPKQWLKRL